MSILAERSYSPFMSRDKRKPGHGAPSRYSGRPGFSLQWAQKGAAMTKAMFAGFMIAGLGACSGADARVSRAAPPPEQSLAIGTVVTATIQDSVSSRISRRDDTLRAIVGADVKGPHSGVVIPAGSGATLTIALIEPGSDAGEPEGKLSLLVTSVTVNGDTYPVVAELQAVPSHLQDRAISVTATPARQGARRDVVVSAGTPIVFALKNSLMVSAR
jgi:hypothetical protein